MPKKEVYRSSTLGDIPLSFTGRHLLQSLREEVCDMVAGIKAGANLDAANWEPVSRARGRIAKYMSDLEAKNVPSFACTATDKELLEECSKRGLTMEVPKPTLASHPDFELAHELMLRGYSVAKGRFPKTIRDFSNNELVKEMNRRLQVGEL